MPRLTRDIRAQRTVPAGEARRKGLASTGARERSERPRRSRPPHGRTAGRLCSGDALSVRVGIFPLSRDFYAQLATEIDYTVI